MFVSKLLPYIISNIEVHDPRLIQAQCYQKTNVGSGWLSQRANESATFIDIANLLPVGDMPRCMPSRKPKHAPCRETWENAIPRQEVETTLHLTVQRSPLCSRAHVLHVLIHILCAPFHNLMYSLNRYFVNSFS